MIRVVIVAGQLGLGGAERQLFFMLRGICRRRFFVEVVSFGESHSQYWRQRIEALGVPVYEWGALTRTGRMARLGRLVVRGEAHVLHAWDFFTGPYAALVGRTVGATVMGSLRETLGTAGGGKTLRRIGRTGLDMVVVNSRTTLRSLTGTEMDGTPCEVVPNGVEVGPVCSSVERTRRRIDLGIAEESLVVMSCGRLDGNKNPLLLLEAFATLHGVRPPPFLLMVGEGPLAGDVARRARELGLSDRVRLLGTVPEAAALMPIADIVALTSRSEGMPNVLMEASAAGVPVVATDVGGVREIVESDVTGFVEDRADPKTIGYRLAELLASPHLRKAMGVAGKEKMRREFGVEKMVQRFSHLYEKVTEGR